MTAKARRRKAIKKANERKKTDVRPEARILDQAKHDSVTYVGDRKFVGLTLGQALTQAKEAVRPEAQPDGSAVQAARGTERAEEELAAQARRGDYLVSKGFVEATRSN